MNVRPSRWRLPRPAVPTGLAAAGLALVLALAGCSASSGSSAAQTVGSPAVAADAEGVPAAGVPAAEPGGAAAAGSGAGASAPAGTRATSPGVAVGAQRLVKTASLLLRVNDVLVAASDVRAIAAGAGGAVTGEDLVTVDGPAADPTPTATPAAQAPAGGAGAATPDPALEAVRKAGLTSAGRSTSGTMTVSVPVARLGTTLDQLSKLGTVTQRSTSTADVTSTYVDTASRIATMTASIDRVRALMTKATALDQVVSLEGELSRREADLEALKAQLASLDQQTTMATITLSLATAGTTTGTPVDESGFLAGLRSGWAGFVTVATGLATGLGAVLPFVATIAVIGLPVAGWWRRRRVHAGRTDGTHGTHGTDDTGATDDHERVPVGAPAGEEGESPVRD